MQMKSFLRRSVFIVLAAVLTAASAMAQLSTGSFFGTISDETGAAIPGATVTLTQTDTNVSRTVKTEGNGAYRADFLPIGPYTATVTAPGFSTLQRKGLVLNVTEVAQLDLSLKAGGEQQTIEVTADVPLVNLGNSTLGRTVTNEEIDNLPLVNRDVYALLDLTPGVQNNNGDVQPLGFPEQHVKINGSTDNAVGQVSYYLDGALNMTGLRNTGLPLPNPDAIKEFAVQTNNFSAQFGRSSGGFVTALTKSGTNQFHGSVFEFYRTKNFTATTHADKTKKDYNQHRFGFTVGGPIKRDKLFFFGSYGGFRYITADTLKSLVPSAAMRTGNFSENIRTDGNTNCYQNTGTNTATVTATSSTRFTVCNPRTHTAYAGNIVPISDFDPSVRAIIDAGLIPLPNPGPGESVYQRTDLQRTTQQRDEMLFKGDYKFTQKQQLTLSYFRNKGDQLLNPSGNNVAGWTQHRYKFAQHNASIQHVWTVTNSTVNQLFLGYTRLIGGRIATPAEDLSAYGSSIQVQGTPSRPQMAVTGWFQAGNAITGPTTGSNIYSLRDLVSSTHGKHTLYLGGEVNLEKDAQQTLLNNYGIFAFSQVGATKVNSTPQYPGQVSTNGGYLPIRSQAAITDFFFGTPNTFNQDAPVYANANYWNFGAFFQDDWRITPRLTLNLGVRYDIQTPPLDTQRRTLNFKAGVQSTVSPGSPAGLLFPGDPGVPEGGTPTEYTHVSPRVGFAWNPFGDGRTVIHGGGGIFYGTVSGNEWEYPSNNQPFAVRAQYKKVISVHDPYLDDPQEFCADPSGGCTTGTSPYPFVYDKANPRYIRPSAIIGVDPNYHWPAIYQVNFGIQQQFTRGFAVTINYVGSMSRYLPMMLDYNYPQFNLNASGASGIGSGCTTAMTCGYSNATSNVDNRRPLNQALPGGAAKPTFSNVYIISSSESSNYHGLQISAEQRLTHNFSVKGFYIWSKTLSSNEQDTTGNTGNSAASAFEDPNFRYLEKQRSDFDQRHVGLITFIYKPNYGLHNRIARLAVNGWTVSSIIRMQSGRPFNITAGSDLNADANNNDRPNIRPGAGTPHLKDNGRSRAAMMNQWVSPEFFCPASGYTGACTGTGPAGIDGTIRPNLLDSPGYRDIDASLFRDFRLYENMKLQLRGEATNVFNLTNLGNPTSTTSSSTFGQINGARGNNRILQIGARILF